MSIKMIVTDLDGTFYHRDLTYDKARFMRLYEKMKQQGIHFVVASGNQYYQLISFFDEIKDELTFVSENGAYIVDPLAISTSSLSARISCSWDQTKYV